jgi:hypothetical protein
MTLPTDFKWNSGKQALMGSLAEYFTAQITDETFDFDNPIIPVKLPSYGVVEKGLYNQGVMAFDNLLGYRNGQPLYGRRDQTLIEISAWDDVSIHSDAAGKVRQMRDKIVYVLYNAGREDDSGVLVLPPIKLYNYYATPKVEIGVIELDPSDNSINEKFVVDPINQNIKVYKLLVRLFWYEYLNQ